MLGALQGSARASAQLSSRKKSLSRTPPPSARASTVAAADVRRSSAPSIAANATPSTAAQSPVASRDSAGAVRAFAAVSTWRRPAAVLAPGSGSALPLHGNIPATAAAAGVNVVRAAVTAPTPPVTDHDRWSAKRGTANLMPQSCGDATGARKRGEDAVALSKLKYLKKLDASVAQRALSSIMLFNNSSQIGGSSSIHVDASVATSAASPSPARREGDRGAGVDGVTGSPSRGRRPDPATVRALLSKSPVRVEVAWRDEPMAPTARAVVGPPLRSDGGMQDAAATSSIIAVTQQRDGAAPAAASPQQQHRRAGGGVEECWGDIEADSDRARRVVTREEDARRSQLFALFVEEARRRRSWRRRFDASGKAERLSMETAESTFRSKIEREWFAGANGCCAFHGLEFGRIAQHDYAVRWQEALDTVAELVARARPTAPTQRQREEEPSPAADSRVESGASDEQVPIVIRHRRHAEPVGETSSALQLPPSDDGTAASHTTLSAAPPAFDAAKHEESVSTLRSISRVVKASFAPGGSGRAAFNQRAQSLHGRLVNGVVDAVFADVVARSVAHELQKKDLRPEEL